MTEDPLETLRTTIAAYREQHDPTNDGSYVSLVCNLPLAACGLLGMMENGATLREIVDTLTVVPSYVYSESNSPPEPTLVGEKQCLHYIGRIQQALAVPPLEPKQLPVDSKPFVTLLSEFE